MTVEEHLKRIAKATTLEQLSDVARYSDWLLENERIPDADEHAQILAAIRARRQYIVNLAATP